MENCLEEAPQSSQDYYPYYNLFQSSIFYDTDNFRVSYLSYKFDDCLPSKSSVNEEKSAEPPDKPKPPEPPEPPEPPAPPEPEAPPASDRRVIRKDDLFRDPDHFKSKFVDGSTNKTKHSWVKERAPRVNIREVGLKGWDGCPKAKGRAVDIRNVGPKGQAVEPIGPRIKCSKGESMMQKMGWQGGALGKSGEKITQPVTPDPVCAFRSSVGFGQRTKPTPAPAPAQPPQAPAQPAPAQAAQALKRPRRDAFRTNVLLHVLEFVQDDTEMELLFDPTLRHHERRHIMNIIDTVVNDCQVHVLGSVAQYELAADIYRHNRYTLETMLQGAAEKPQLGIFKEPPEDVYLVTPDDFLPKDDATDSDKSEYDTKEPNDNCMELDDDENPFLKSIKKSIKKDQSPAVMNKLETDCSIAKDGSKDVVRKVESPVPPEEKMVEFFLEFAETDSYKELRFLGKFTDEQLSAINSLLNDVALWSVSAESEGQTETATACRAAGCRLIEGVNGTTEIHKVTANSQDDD